MDVEKVIEELEDSRRLTALQINAKYHRSQFELMIKGIGDALDLLKEQEKRISELEEKLRLLEYGDQDILQSGMMPAT